MTLIARPENFIPSVWNDFIEKSLFANNANGHSERNIPKVNLSEDDKNFYIDLAVPGLSKENFKINLLQNRLTISAEETTKVEDKKFSRIEFGFSSFSRTFTLPKTADADKIEAAYSDGILQLTIGKKEVEKEKLEKMIEIK